MEFPTIDTTETLGHVATVYPDATQVFLRHRLDFCCGGGQTLADACRRAGLDPAAVIAEIKAYSAPKKTPRWDREPLPDLVQFILTRYHKPLRDDLTALLEAAQKVERVHAQKPNCPQGLAAHLERVAEEIEQHLAKEEQVLFPALLAGSRGAHVHMPIRVMMEEHEDHGANLELLRTLAGNYEAPPEACATWRALYSGLEKLESELMEHIHLENNVLFPRALSS